MRRPDQPPTEPPATPELTFIPLSPGEDSDEPDSDYDPDDIPGKKEERRLAQMIEGGLTTRDIINEGDRLRNVLAHEFNGLPRYEPRFIQAGRQGALSDHEDVENFVGVWIPNMERMMRTRTNALRSTIQQRDPVLNSPGEDNYLADREDSPKSDSGEHPIQADPTPLSVKSTGAEAKGLPKYATALKSTIRFCVFNVGNISKPEFWDIIKLRLTPEILGGVTRIENVNQPNGRKRMDMWVAVEVAMRLKSALYLTATARRNGTRVDHKYPLRELLNIWHPNNRTRHWRIDVYRSWREREHSFKAPRCTRLERPRKGIATFNVNGIGQKKLELQNFLKQRNIGVLAIQETLVDKNKYALCLPGYDIYERSKTTTFRGQALAIHSSYTSYEVGKDKENSFIHVKVVGLTEGAPWHIIAVYLPSGGNNRSNTTACLKKVLAEYKSIQQKEPGARVLLLGDFNIKREKLKHSIRPKKSGLEVLSVMGNGATFHRKSSKWSNIDSIVASPSALLLLRKAKVARQWCADPKRDSDHFPLVTTLRAKTDIAQEAPPVKYRFNTDLVKGQASNIVHHNRWSCLPVEEISSVAQLNSEAETFVNTINTIGLELGVKQPVEGRSFTYDRVLKKRVRKTRLARAKWMAAAKEGSKEAETLMARWKEMRSSLRKAIQAKEQRMEDKRTAQVTEWFRDGEMRAFHRWESNHTVVGGLQNLGRVTPVKDKSGTLLIDNNSILNRTTEYYKDLAQDDSEKLSQNQDHWKGKAKSRREEALPCNESIVWKHVLMAIRNMALGTSPSDDDVPVEIYKAILKEECHTYLRSKGVPVGECTYVALPEKDLPETPTTPMGKQLYRIVTGMWKNAAQPEVWAKATMISIHKSGDPTDLLNYRGISLIAVGVKIFTVILAMRISKLAELNDLFVKEQGGFRSGEEAIAQFVALAEIVRRRRLHDQKTWVAFIDFKKAFDKVMHEALFEKLDAMGFRGHFLEVIKSVYRTSKAQVRVGGKLGDAYDMLRGTRQGCPLSPILFLIFINDILQYVPKGVKVPGVKEGPKECPALLFADDVAGLAEDKEGVEAFLDGITEWSDKWALPIGATKCGIMLIGGTEEEQKELEKETFSIAGEKVEVVRKYKYLGINITDKLGDREFTDEYAHCRTLADKVKKAVDMRRPFLRDRRYPVQAKLAVINSKITSVGCYGGEWVGMCQERTSIIQKEVNKALKVVLNSSTKSNLHATMPMSIELGTPTIEQRMSELRIRLWQKAPKMRTWLGHLIKPENRFEGKIKVWTTGTQHLLHRLLPYQTKWSHRGVTVPPLEREAIDLRVKALLAKNDKYDYCDDPLDDRNRESPMRQKQEAKVTVIARAIYKDMYPAQGSRPVNATIDYMSFGYDRTRDYIKSAVYTPNLTEGTIWLIRLRIGAWWTTKRRTDVLRSRGEDVPNANICPCCGAQFYDEPEFCHILLTCKSWEDERKSTINPLISYLKREVASGNGRLNVEHRRLEIAVLMLGGSIRRKDHIPMYKSNRPAGTDVRNDAPDTLDAFACGWGGEGEIHIPGLNAHGFAPVAKFLALVMPRHKAKLFPPQGESNTDLVAYDTTAGEESPVKRTSLPRGVVYGTAQDLEELRDRSGSPSPQYPPGRITQAVQAEAMSGMGTRCIHANHTKNWDDIYDMLGPVYCESDEESLFRGEGECPDRCYPHLTVIS